MKRVLVLGSLLALAPVCGWSQGLIMNAGDSYTCEFNDLQLEIPGTTNSTITRVLVGRQSFSGSFEFEAFESSLAEQPLFSATVTPSDSSDFYFGPAWQDLQGFVRVTMLSGSMNLRVILGAVTTPAGDIYSQSIYPVPEPVGSSWMAGMMAGAAALRTVKRRGAND